MTGRTAIEAPLGLEALLVETARTVLQEETALRHQRFLGLQQIKILINLHESPTMATADRPLPEALLPYRHEA